MGEEEQGEKFPREHFLLLMIPLACLWILLKSGAGFKQRETLVEFVKNPSMWSPQWGFAPFFAGAAGATASYLSFGCLSTSCTSFEELSIYEVLAAAFQLGPLAEEEEEEDEEEEDGEDGDNKDDKKKDDKKSEKKDDKKKDDKKKDDKKKDDKKKSKDDKKDKKKDDKKSETKSETDDEETDSEEKEREEEEEMEKKWERESLPILNVAFQIFLGFFVTFLSGKLGQGNQSMASVGFPRAVAGGILNGVGISLFQGSDALAFRDITSLRWQPLIGMLAFTAGMGSSAAAKSL